MRTGDSKGLAWMIVAGCGMLWLVLLVFLVPRGWSALNEMGAEIHRGVEAARRDPVRIAGDDEDLPVWMPSDSDPTFRTVNAADWIRPGDYPADAIRRGAEGVSTIRITFGDDGVPSDCAIVKGSGDASLDRAACGAVMLRGLMPPVEQAPDLARVKQRRIVWRLPTLAEDFGIKRAP